MTLDCHDTGPLLSAALDGELTATEMATLDEHLNRCQACRRQRDALELLRTGLRATGPDTATAAFARQLDGAVANSRQRHRWLRRPTTRLVGLAAAAVLVAMIWLLPPADTEPDMTGAEAGREHMEGSQCRPEWSLM